MSQAQGSHFISRVIRFNGGFNTLLVIDVQAYSPKYHYGQAGRGSFVVASLLRLDDMLAASNSLVIAVPGVVFALGIVSFGGVPIMRGISRMLRSGRGSRSN